MPGAGHNGGDDLLPRLAATGDNAAMIALIPGPTDMAIIAMTTAVIAFVLMALFQRRSRDKEDHD